MKAKYIAGAVILLIFLGMAIFSFDSSKIEYTDIAQAKESGETVQLVGSLMQEKPMDYDGENNLFTFWVKDDSSRETKVILNGMKPNNFELAPKLVIKGKFSQDEFLASEVLTKCPSTYEGNMESTDY